MKLQPSFLLMIYVGNVAKLHHSSIMGIRLWGNHPAPVPATSTSSGKGGLQWSDWKIWPHIQTPRIVMTTVCILRMWRLAYLIKGRGDKVYVHYVVPTGVKFGLSSCKQRFSVQPMLAVMLFYTITQMTREFRLKIVTETKCSLK